MAQGRPSVSAKTPVSAVEHLPQLPPVAPPTLPEKLTPMMQQYVDTKAQVGDAILFFRLGDFYEMFFDDALKAAQALHITLTSRAKGDERVPMCGVPYHAARRYIGRLVDQGFKVAICEQVEEAGGPQIVKREVVRIVTPGMVVDENLLEPAQNNFLAALKPPDSPDGPWGAALLDASTGEFVALTPGQLSELSPDLLRVNVGEVLVPEGTPPSAFEPLLSGYGKRPALATLEADVFQVSRARAFLTQHFQVQTLDSFGLADSSASVGAAGAALRYLKDTQKSDGGHVDRLSLQPRGGYLVLDESTRAHLELTKSLKDSGRSGTLLSVLDRTVTPLGARKLASWLVAPLASVPAITTRLDAVEELVKKASYREGLVESLKGVQDVERLCARLSLKTGTPRDLRALGVSLAGLPRLGESLGKASAGLLSLLKGPLCAEAIVALGQTLQSAIVDEPPAVTAEGGFIREGFNSELDGYLKLSTSGKSTLLELEAREKARTGIGSLKVRYNKVFGYYLEVTKANLHLVPKDWVRKQTMVGGERYVTEELKGYEEKVLSADEKRVGLELRLFEELRALVVSKASQLRAAAAAVAALDALCSFASVSAERGYCRPTLDESEVLRLSEARHPVVELALDGGSFVPNDTRLDRDACQLLVITGPNMAGKSTVMRQVALSVVMAQAGCFVPAKAAHIGLCDRVFTRVGASDNLARGQSTFMVEMTETANILHHATQKSLVVLDEIGRGTSTFDGLSIAWAVAEHLHDVVGARTMFATHYHELTDLARERPKVKNACIAVKERDGRVTFLRKLVEGAASKSYGIEVARLAGLPREVLERARELLMNLEAQELDEVGHARLARKAKNDHQLALFGEPQSPDPVLQALRELDLDQTTPLQALNAISAWKQALAARKPR
ncbi:MAG: DNA mismatch repair protein MutS [Archangiaceae bacterium]|nr:DNA mismatch repair protein MutS [Archangiaceae bacterium]